MAHTDAVTGIAVTGETITGTWWAEPAEATLDLGAYVPGVSIVSGSSTEVDPPQGELQLAASLPTVVVIESVTIAAPQAALQLAGTSPTSLTISSTMLPPEAQLHLLAGPTTITFVGQVWLHEFTCIEDDLAPAPDPVVLDLVPSTCR